MKCTAKKQKSQRTEADALLRCEEIIERGLKAYIDAGLALAEINERRLYRNQYGTFGEYCEQRWLMSRGHAYRLVDAAIVARNCLQLETRPPENEGVARELVRFAPDKQPLILQKAREMFKGEPTACQIRKAVAAFLYQQPADAQTVDNEAQAVVSTFKLSRCYSELRDMLGKLSDSWPKLRQKMDHLWEGPEKENCTEADMFRWVVQTQFLFRLYDRESYRWPARFRRTVASLLRDQADGLDRLDGEEETDAPQPTADTELVEQEAA